MSGQNGTSSPEVRASLASLLTSLCHEHGIAPVPSLEWSKRMSRVLGRAYYRSNLIRLSAWLDETQAKDTLRHELAHIAAGQAKGEGPHGPRWREWAVRLGANPRATAHNAPLHVPERPDLRNYWGLECPACGYRLMRLRVLRGLYHRDCGPRRGMLRRVVRGQRHAIAAWLQDRAARQA